MKALIVYGFIAASIAAIVLTVVGFTIYQNDAHPWGGWFVPIFFGTWIAALVMAIPSFVVVATTELTRGRH